VRKPRQLISGKGKRGQIKITITRNGPVKGRNVSLRKKGWSTRNKKHKGGKEPSATFHPDPRGRGDVEDKLRKGVSEKKTLKNLESGIICLKGNQGKVTSRKKGITI